MNTRLRGSAAIWLPSAIVRGSTRSACGPPPRTTTCSNVSIFWGAPSSSTSISSGARSWIGTPSFVAYMSTRTKLAPPRKTGGGCGGGCPGAGAAPAWAAGVGGGGCCACPAPPASAAMPTASRAAPATRPTLRRATHRLTPRRMVAANTAISASSAAVTASAITGYFSASMPRPTTNTSSPRLRAQFENGSGLVLTIARVPALVRWVLPATTPPSSAASAVTVGVAWPSAVIAISAPPTGRMKVWMVSHAVSTHGILSVRNSTR